MCFFIFGLRYDSVYDMTYKWMELTHGEAQKGDRMMGKTSTFTGISCSSKCFPQCGVSQGTLYYLVFLSCL